MKLTLRQLRRAVVHFFSFLIFAGGGYWLGIHQVQIELSDARIQSFKVTNKTAPPEKDLDFSLFWKVWNKLEEKYLIKENIDQEQMFYGAIRGLASSLGDPYTVFLPPQANKKVKEDLNGSFEGVGIQLGFNKEKRLTVIAPIKGMPAEAAGVRSGDIIIHLKDEEKGIDEDTLEMSLPEAVEKIRGVAGTKIILTLIHPGEADSYDAEIVRQTIIVPSVEVDFLEAKNNREIAHLKLMRFGDLTAEQWDHAVDLILTKEDQVKGVILDVRNNPGGYLRGAVNLASEFLSKGVIVKQEDYRGEVETYSVNRKGRLLEIPMVVLIDGGSASASEILAGCLQDHKRAKLVGVSSFGKGTIQESEDLDSQSALHITTAKWLTPEGRWVDGEGLKPDEEVENDPDKSDEDKQLEKAKELLDK